MGAVRGRVVRGAVQISASPNHRPTDAREAIPGGQEDREGERSPGPGANRIRKRRRGRGLLLPAAHEPDPGCTPSHGLLVGGGR
jgi:hypothetical protein